MKNQKMNEIMGGKLKDVRLGAGLVSAKGNREITNIHGITLIALVITIIILLILAGVVLNLTLGEHGIIKMAEKAGKNYINVANEELNIITGITNEVQNIINGETDVSAWSDKVEATLADVKNTNIGDYIDLGNDPLSIGDTTKNWRIFYKEGEMVYAILADFLPNSSGYATSAGLNTTNIYNIQLVDNRNSFIATLKDSTKWNALTNGINGAKAVGTPTTIQLEKSWNNKYPNNTLNVPQEISEYINISNEDSLYIPHKDPLDNKTCYGYWLASPYGVSDVCVMYCAGTLAGGDSYYAIRPVVSLPNSIKVEHTGNIWIVKNN